MQAKQPRVVPDSPFTPGAVRQARSGRARLEAKSGSSTKFLRKGPELYNSCTLSEEHARFREHPKLAAGEVLCQQLRRRDQLLALRANNRELPEASLVSDAGTLLLHLSRVARLNTRAVGIICTSIGVAFVNPHRRRALDSLNH
jgi:hypothetical protein